MILIFSIYNDYTTTLVCEWLRHKNEPFVRINGNKDESVFISADTQKNQYLFRHNVVNLDLGDVTSVWYRKSGLSSMNFQADYFVEDGEFFFENDRAILSQTVKNEMITLSDYLHWYFEQVPHLGKRSNATLNKIIVLAQAKAMGLNVPECYILTAKEDLILLLNQKKELITKALKDGIYEFNPKHAYYTYTEPINSEVIQDYPDFFAPTLFQPLIKKKYELRVFFLAGECYSMAIFSQENEETKIDSRKGGTKSLGRRIPFILPNEIKTKLVHLMNKLELNTGSIDIIVDDCDNYIFLEVNPVGQFSMVSEPCNYNLEKKVAEFLCKKTTSMQ